MNLLLRELDKSSKFSDVLKNIENKKESVNEKAISLFKDKNIDEKVINKIKNNLESEYMYIEDAHSPSRISVSNLKKNKNEEDNNDKKSKKDKKKKDDVEEASIEEE